MINANYCGNTVDDLSPTFCCIGIQFRSNVRVSRKSKPLNTKVRLEKLRTSLISLVSAKMIKKILSIFHFYPDFRLCDFRNVFKAYVNKKSGIN